MSNLGNHRSVCREQGLALVISLVLLVAMTVIAIATMSGTRLNERISSNSQQKAISFEAAESAISSVWNEYPGGKIFDLIPSTPSDDPPAEPVPGKSELLSVIYDQYKEGEGVGDTPTADITADVTVQYCGESNPTNGTSISANLAESRMMDKLLDINGFSSIAGSNAAADHLLRVSLPNNATGRTGNCVAPN